MPPRNHYFALFALAICTIAVGLFSCTWEPTETVSEREKTKEPWFQIRPLKDILIIIWVCGGLLKILEKLEDQVQSCCDALGWAIGWFKRILFSCSETVRNLNGFGRGGAGTGGADDTNSRRVLLNHDANNGDNIAYTSWTERGPTV